MDSICGLCGKNEKLLESHLIPKFVVKYLKDTSVTNRLRNSLNPNIPQQDGEKYHLFCNLCENVFSIEEKIFAERIFFPFHLGQLHEFEYDYHLGRFCAIQALKKIIANNYLRDLSKQYPPKMASKINKALEFFKSYLLSNGKTQDEYSNHIIFFNFIEETSGNLPLPDNINVYLTRTMDSSIISSKNGKLIIYSKMAKIAIFTFIVPRKPRDFSGTRVFGYGSFEANGHKVLPEALMHFFIDRTNKIEEVHSRISDNQNRKIAEIYSRNNEKIDTSECMKAVLADEALRRRMQ